jgi:outer membrane biosynthesis protein TonB
MAKSHARTYNSGPYSLEKMLGLMLFVSLGLHILASWVFFFIIPAYQTRRDLNENIMVVQLIGNPAPPAPAAPPMKVNPDQKGPDVVELPSTPPQPTPPPVQNQPEPIVPAPEAEVIPIAPPKTPPLIEKTAQEPPKPTPPPREEVKPKPVPKPSLESQINNRMRQLERERKVAAENTDDIIAQRVANLAAAQGQGQGEGSDIYGGATTGTRLDPAMTAYYTHVRDIVSKNWVAPSDSLAADLEAQYTIRIEPNGRVSASSLRVKSGSADYDLSIERAVKKSVFPPLPSVFNNQAVTAVLRFRLNEMRQGSY